MQAGSPVLRAQAFPIAILVVTLLCVPFLLFGSDGVERVRELEGELVQIREENGKLEAECRDLRRRVESYRSDPSFIESVAREELGVVRPDEMVIVLPEP